MPIPPNTPGVEPYGEDVVPVEEVPPMEGVVVPVPAVLFRKINHESNYLTSPQMHKSTAKTKTKNHKDIIITTQF